MTGASLGLCRRSSVLDVTADTVCRCLVLLVRRFSLRLASFESEL